MKIKQIKEQTDQMKVDDNTKNAIINLIDLKTESDMDKILEKMNGVEKSMRSIEKSMSREVKIVYWVVGIAMAIMLAILAFKK